MTGGQAGKNVLYEMGITLNGTTLIETNKQMLFQIDKSCTYFLITSGTRLRCVEYFADTFVLVYDNGIIC